MVSKPVEFLVYYIVVAISIIFVAIFIFAPDHIVTRVSGVLGFFGLIYTVIWTIMKNIRKKSQIKKYEEKKNKPDVYIIDRQIILPIAVDKYRSERQIFEIPQMRRHNPPYNPYLPLSYGPTQPRWKR